MLWFHFKKAVWPDFAKFHDFGEISKVFGQLLKAFIITWKNLEPTLANVLCCWAYLHSYKWPNIKNSLAIWSRCSGERERFEWMPPRKKIEKAEKETKKETGEENVSKFSSVNFKTKTSPPCPAKDQVQYNLQIVKIGERLDLIF